MKSDNHKNMQETIKNQYISKGYIAVIEHYINGKKIDVLVQDIKTKHSMAYEIQLSSQHCIENIHLDFKAGCDEVIIVSDNENELQKMREAASRNLDKNTLSKVKFQLMQEFIPHTNKNNNAK